MILRDGFHVGESSHGFRWDIMDNRRIPSGYCSWNKPDGRHDIITIDKQPHGASLGIYRDADLKIHGLKVMKDKIIELHLFGKVGFHDSVAIYADNLDNKNLPSIDLWVFVNGNENSKVEREFTVKFSVKGIPAFSQCKKVNIRTKDANYNDKLLALFQNIIGK